MAVRTRYPVAVHLIFVRDARVLLARRFNTGWRDGDYSVPAGHVEPGETVRAAAQREAQEEVGVRLELDDLIFSHVMHRKSDDERIDFFFTVRRWPGEPVNAEPGKCDSLVWYAFDALPANTVPYVREALAHLSHGIPFSENGWPPE